MEKKVYTKRSEKVTDFFIGFLGIPVFVAVIQSVRVLLLRTLMIMHVNSSAERWLFAIVGIITLMLVIAIAIFLSIKRKYIRIGLLFAVVTTFLLVGGCFLFFYMALTPKY